MEILCGIISEVTKYTVELVGRQVGYLINYKTNLESLKSQFKKLNLAKERMESTVEEGERKGKRVHTDVQDWQKGANGMIEKAQIFFEDEGRANTKCFGGICPNLVSYHHLSMKSAKLAEKIELHAKKEFASIFYDVPQEEIFDTPSEDYMAFESRISKVKEIMDELRNPDTNLIGVYGLGGVGKSTLAKEVYRQARKEKLFDDVVVVLDVKQYPELERNEKIKIKIAEKLGMDVEKTQDMHIWNRIKDKKSLIILDDVWEKIDLEVLGLRPMATCKILFTSRVRVSEMRTQTEFWLDVLGEKESWSLFEKMAGDVVKDDPIQKVATQVAQKCGGLPVLVVTVASALRLNSNLGEWKDTLRRFKRFDNKELTEKALLAIEWSYNRLDAKELQPLFLLCGIIAVGSNSIYLFYLLHCALGLGLIKNVDTLEEARNALHVFAKKLKYSCLLLDGNEDGTVRMHELVREVAILIASRDQHAFSRVYGDELKEWPNRDFLKKCSAISLMSCKIPRLPEVPWVCPELRFFFLESDEIDDSLEIPGNFFEGMNELKVLDVTRLRIPSLPPSLQSLTNLQTLCLDQCVLGDIALVGQLTNLKILSLLISKVKELPKEIGQLTRLQLLDLTGCSELVVIPAGVISSLTSLEDLRMGGFKEWEGGLNDGRSNASVSELKRLRRLTALEIHIPDAKLLPANMFSDTRLERYTILIGDCWPTPPFFNRTSSNKLKLKLTTDRQFDQGIKLLLEICEDLELDGMAANIISHILTNDSGKQLKNLHVINSSHAFPNLESAFPNLESLYLENLVNLETVCCGQLIDQPFQKLRSLTLRNLPKLIGFSSKGSTSVVSREGEEIILENEIGGPTKLFMNGEVLMPNLTSLVVDKCGGLRFLFSSSMARSLVQLKNLKISRCQIMEEIVSTNESSEEDTDHNMFSQLQDLSLQYLPNLTRFCSARRSINFHSLEILRLWDCSKLETFIFDPRSTNITINKATEEISDSTENIGNDARYFLFDEKVGFPSLESLIIRGLPVLRTIWHNQLAQDSFCKLKKVEVLRCNTLINIFAPSMMGRLNALDTLKIRGCKSLQVVFEQTYDTSTTQLKTFECPNLDSIKTFEYSGFQERFDSGPLIRQPFLLVDTIALRQLTALHIHIPDANLLPANMFSDTRLERYTIFIGDCWPRYHFIYGTSSNMLKLKLTTNSQFDQGIKLLLERCEDLALDGNIISYILASGSGKHLKKLHVQNNDEVTAVINSSHAFPNLESLSLENLVNLETVCCGQLIDQPFQKLRSLTLRNLPNLIGFSSKGSTSVVSTEAKEIILENEIGGPTKLFMNEEVLMPNLTRLIHARKSEITSMSKENEDWNSKENLETVIPHFLFDEKVRFSSLESLIIYDMPKLRTIWHNRLAPDSFCKLKKVEVLRCNTLINIFAPSMMGRLNALDTLKIQECKSLQAVFEQTYDTSTTKLFLNGEGNPFPSLETLYLNTEIWYEAHDPLPAELFINLKAIQFSCAQPPPISFPPKIT